jgi:predicted DNA-binding transcriptional regulator AlpA
VKSRKKRSEVMTSLNKQQRTGDIEPAFLRVAACVKYIGIPRSTLYALERAGRFPKRTRLSAGISGWRKDAVDSWLAQR